MRKLAVIWKLFGFFFIYNKGWHRRFFFLENAVLSYAKNSGEMARGRSQGQIDLAIAFISYKAKDQRIDIDADEFIYHLKVSSSFAGGKNSQSKAV